MSKPLRRTAGRPPAGPAGERVSEFPRITIRLPRATKDRLLALAALRRAPAWQIIDQAVTAFLAALPDDERRAVTGFAAKMGSR